MSSLTKPAIAALAHHGCPHSLGELTDLIKSSGCVSVEGFNALEAAILATEGFLERTLPFIWAEAVQADEVLPRDMPICDEPGRITFTQRQCLCILANGFFCSFKDRMSNNCMSGPDLPSINFDELYNGHGWSSVKQAKLKMLFNYFEQCRLRHLGGDPFSRSIHFVRRRASASTAAEWAQCRAPLLPPVMHPLGTSLDEAKEMFRVDFANQVVGGAALAYGCVQEEILFCVCPELNVARLVFPVMKADEAIIMIGAEQFSKPIGYASDLQYGGPYRDPSPTTPAGDLASYICAIDALDLRDGDLARQYAPSYVVRELTKAWAGFHVEEAPKNLATGNWGCGAFGGDAGLKSLIQWLAASRAGKTMHYFPWSDEHIHALLPTVARSYTQKGATVGDVAHFLLSEMQRDEDRDSG